MSELWEEIGRERYGVTEPKLLRMRYGVQVNCLGLTEAQPENNVQRIVLEALAVTLGRNARARAIQLPAWNEALGLPRPWDQQWSLRIQQMLAYETDLLEYPDIFEGSKVMDGLVAELVEGAREEMAVVDEQGGAVEAVAYMKARLVESHRERIAKIERERDQGRRPELLHRDRGLAADRRAPTAASSPPTPRSSASAARRSSEWKAERDYGGGRARARASSPRPPRDESREHHAGDDRGREGGRDHRRVGAARCATCSATTARPTGVSGAAAGGDEELLASVRARVDELAERIGHRPRILVGKPGLDGHSNGAEQIAVRARDVGMEVIYQGIRLTPEQIAASARDEDVDVVGLSILSGSHLELIPETVRLLREHGVDVPVVVGGIIPAADAERLREAGVAGVYTPKDFDVNRIMGEIVDLVGERAGLRRGLSRAGREPARTRREPARRSSSRSRGLERRRGPPAADGRGRRRRRRRSGPGPRHPAVHDRPRSLRRGRGPPMAADLAGGDRLRHRPDDGDRRRRGRRAARGRRASQHRPRDRPLRGRLLGRALGARTRSRRARSRPDLRASPSPSSE